MDDEDLSDLFIQSLLLYIKSICITFVHINHWVSAAHSVLFGIFDYVGQAFWLDARMYLKYNFEMKEK